MAYYLPLKNIIGLQYGGQGCPATRDMEMVRLKSIEPFTNPASTPNEPTVPFFACKFSPVDPFGDIFACADEIGNLSLHNVKNSQEVIISMTLLNNAIFDITWVPGESKILAQCGDHTSRLYDVGEGNITHVATFIGHTKSVKAADFMPQDSAVFATGSRDGNIFLYDSRAFNKSVDKIFKADQCIPSAAGFNSSNKNKKQCQMHSSSVTALAFQDRNSLICCGSTDEYIRIWDMRLTHCQWKDVRPRAVKKTCKKGYNDLKISSDRTRLYVSSIGGPISCFNLHSASEASFSEFHGHDAGSFYVKTCISADGEYLASGSTDRAVHVWKTSGAERERGGRRPMLRLPGHRAEVTGVDISHRSRLTMVSCADDGSVRSWLPTATELDQQDATQDMDAMLAGLAIAEPLPPQTSVCSFPSTSRCRFSSRSKSPTSLSSNAMFHSADVNSVNLLDSAVLFTTETQLKTEKKQGHLTPPRRAVRTDVFSSYSGKRKLVISPNHNVKRVTLSPLKNNSEYISPTLNLPNYVLEGTGPSHTCPRVRHKENVNWLTEIRRKSSDKRSQSVDKERRQNRRGGSKSSSRRTLLEYYKKSSKVNDETIKSEVIANNSVLGP